MTHILSKVLRIGEGAKVEKLNATVAAVAAKGQQVQALSDEALRAKTDEFRGLLKAGEPLEALLPEAFAVVREAAHRVLGKRPYDVQVMGGVALAEGKIAEMKTGEGKTLAATMPVYLRALEGKGVHVVTSNDYLAKRDAAENGPLFEFLGLSVGLVQDGMDVQGRKVAYGSDVTYGTNAQFGFDFLRDNIATSPKERVQRDLHFAVVDEVDSILIDEARTPLIISGMPEQSAGLYQKFAQVVAALEPTGDFEVDIQKRQVTPTAQGIAKVERALGIENLYDVVNTHLVNHLNQALKARVLFERDREYIVEDGQVQIVDEFTGRVLEGRRYSDGLHQAIEAKEGVEVKEENQTIATITLQNFFRQYDTLAGMTGTAATEADELFEVYEMEVVCIPTNKPMIRKDQPDVVFATVDAKYQAVAEEVAKRHQQGQPVLVGTVSVEGSERLSSKLEDKGVEHAVLNAKHPEREAEIVKQAGQSGAVTIATNMAGRGTDIKLGEGVAHKGGLYVIGTERHESRRIDQQLRGRAGRQGDPGESRFYLSLEDDLVQRYGGQRMVGLVERLKGQGSSPLDSSLVLRALDQAQGLVEANNHDLRKRTLEYDDVLNKQREAVYGIRKEILLGGQVDAWGYIEEVLSEIVLRQVPANLFPEEWDLQAMVRELKAYYPAQVDFADLPRQSLTPDAVLQRVLTDAKAKLQTRRAEWDGRAQALAEHGLSRADGIDSFAEAECRTLLSVLDTQWREHLTTMDGLRQGIGWRGLSERDPLVEYKREGFDLFNQMEKSLKRDFVNYIYRIQNVVLTDAQKAQGKPAPAAAAA